MMHRSLQVLALAAACAPALAAQDLPAPGYDTATLAVAPPVNPTGPFGLSVFGAARTLANGDVITFDGLTVERVASDGTPIATLGTIASTSFTGAFAISPDESHALVGESSQGDVYRVNLDGSGMTPLANLPFNFDAVFDGPGTALVSANISMSFVDNDIVRIDTTTGAITNLCSVNGASGPVALDVAGNLYYGLQSSPTKEVIVWTAAQLAGGAPLTELDALTIGTGFDGLSSLAVDPAGGAVYAAVNNFGTGSNRIYRVSGDVSTSSVVLEGTTFFNNIGGLEIVGSSCDGLLAPWQPACGGTLRYSAVDFVSVAYRAELTPARPEGLIIGPGAGPGPGAIAFEVHDGPPSGFAVIFFGSTSDFSLPEIPLVIGAAPPAFSGFSITSIQTLPGFLPLNGDGFLSLGSNDPGGLDGLLTVQALCLDEDLLIRGTTTAAHL